MSDIHPTAVVDAQVEMGQGISIGPYAVVLGPCRIGDDVWIGPHAAIGTPAQIRNGPHRRSDPHTLSGIVIGSGTVIREFVTVHQGSARTTSIGSNCYLMAYAHIPHDATIGNGCTVSNAVQLGGHTIVGDGANLGLGAVVHQWGVIGEGAMVGMQSAVTKPVVPYTTVVGTPAKPLGVNAIAIERISPAIDQRPWNEIALSGGLSPSTIIPAWASTAVDHFLTACYDNGWGAPG